MIKPLILIMLISSILSCVPVRIAPSIKDTEMMVAKKLNRKLPNKTALIFEDPKDANEFYNFINIKYKRNHVNVDSNVPFTIDNQPYYFSFYEIEKTTKTINLLPVLVDNKLEGNDRDPILSDLHTSRSGKWYIVLTASDDNFKDCLKADYPNYNEILKYLKALKKEYLSTHNYFDIILRQK